MRFRAMHFVFFFSKYNIPADVSLLIPIGMSSALVPMYVSEIAPVNLRGGVGIVNQLAVTIGMLLSQVGRHKL